MHATPRGPQVKEGKNDQLEVKTMLTDFRDFKEFVPLGQTVCVAYYIDVIERLRKKIRKEIVANWMLHQYNVPSLIPVPQLLTVQTWFPQTYFHFRGLITHSWVIILTALRRSEPP